MAEYTFPIDTEHNIYPNITVRQILRDEIFTGWRINANEGYVFYDTTAENIELNPDTNEIIPVTYYYTEADFPPNYNWNNFHYVAVPRSEVDENYIFGVVQPPHEIM